ncbi:MAG: hypothetical protein HUU56_05040 [Bdellovibrionaceae bacterium]|nr:hypothetical protein [Pseudobdellovibrionaceae bacterium]
MNKLLHLIKQQPTSSKTYLLSQVLDNHQQQAESFYKGFLDDYRKIENSSSLKESISAVEQLVPVITETTLKIQKLQSSLTPNASSKSQQELSESINVLKITYDGLTFKRKSLIHAIEESHLFFRKFESTAEEINNFKNSLDLFINSLKNSNSSMILDPSLITLGLQTAKTQQEIIDQQLSFLSKLKKQHNEYLNKAIVMNSVTVPKLEQILIEVDNEHPEFNLGFFEAYFTNKQQVKKQQTQSKSNSELNAFMERLKIISEGDEHVAKIQKEFQDLFFVEKTRQDRRSNSHTRISIDKALAILSMVSNKVPLIPKNFWYLEQRGNNLQEITLNFTLPRTIKTDSNPENLFFYFPQNDYTPPKVRAFGFKHEHLKLEDLNVFLNNAFTLMMLTEKTYSYGQSPVVEEFFNFIVVSLQSFKQQTEEQIKTEIKKNKLNHLYTAATDPGTNVVFSLKKRLLAIDLIISELPAVKEAHLNAVINFFALKRSVNVSFEKNNRYFLTLDPDDTF